MVRPKKDPSLRMFMDLRIPVTQDQKALIGMAASAEQSDMAAWARAILIKEAQKRLKAAGMPYQLPKEEGRID